MFRCLEETFYSLDKLKTKVKKKTHINANFRFAKNLICMLK